MATFKHELIYQSEKEWDQDNSRSYLQLYEFTNDFTKILKTKNNE